MSIRAEFQPAVDEFIGTLQSLATGDYLKAEEKEFWEAPFDPSVLGRLRELIERLLENLDGLPDDPDGDSLVAVVRVFIDELAAYNRSTEGAVIEPEEKAELSELIYNAAAATGADDDALAQLPELDF